MVLVIHILAKICPFKKGKSWLKNLATRIRRKCYGGLSPEDITRLRANIFHDIQHILSTAKLHAETFKGFKGAFKGRNVVILGAGPSLKQFKPIPEAIYIGLNRACSFKGVDLDYFFAIDNLGICKYYDDVAASQGIKFIGDQGVGKDGQIPETIIAKLGANVRRYRTDGGHLDCEDSVFATDLETMPLGNFHSVAMQAFQFALYGEPDKIFLVGIDCSANGHFDNSDPQKELVGRHAPKQKVWADGAKRDWFLAKEFAATYYPKIEVISINPVGLAGLFEDIHQI